MFVLNVQGDDSVVQCLNDGQGQVIVQSSFTVGKSGVELFSNVSAPDSDWLIVITRLSHEGCYVYVQ